MAQSQIAKREDVAENVAARMEQIATWLYFLLGTLGKANQMKTLINPLLFMAGLAMLPAPAAFAAAVVKYEPKTSTSMRDALIDLKKERVTLTLDSGEQVEGTVTMVGDYIVYITKLSGKITSDAVVSIDKINMIIFRKEY